MHAIFPHPSGIKFILAEDVDIGQAEVYTLYR